MTDCIVIGSGVAGISAALTLQANGKSFLLFGSAALSEKIEKAECIRNYPGLIAVSGKAFSERLQAQLSEANIAVVDEKVTGVYALKEKFVVTTQRGDVYESRTVILACGVESVKTVEGENEFLGRGLSTCATCDGFLYRGKRIAVFCTSKRLEHEVEWLADLADELYLFPMYKDVAIDRANVRIIRKMPTKFDGGKRLERVLYGAEHVDVDGAFVLRESVSPAALVGGLQMQGGHVEISRDCSTNLKGCFAAGDCTGRPYQYAKAVGEGNVAAHSVTEFLKTQAPCTR